MLRTGMPASTGSPLPTAGPGMTELLLPGARLGEAPEVAPLGCIAAARASSSSQTSWLVEEHALRETAMPASRARAKRLSMVRVYVACCSDGALAWGLARNDRRQPRAAHSIDTGFESGMFLYILGNRRLPFLGPPFFPILSREPRRRPTHRPLVCCKPRTTAAPACVRRMSGRGDE